MTWSSITSAGVDMTPYEAISAKSVTFSTVAAIPAAASATLVRFSSVVQFVHPGPRTFDLHRFSLTESD